MLLNKHNLSIAALASKDESRYTLQAIHVNQDRTAVTDGHIAVMVTLPKDEGFPCVPGFTATNGSAEPFIMDAASALAVCKSIPRRTHIPILKHACVGTNSDGKLSVLVNDLETPQVFQPRVIEGNYPNIELVIPDSSKTTLTIGVDAQLLMKLAKSALEFGDDGRHDVTMKLEFIDANHAIKATVSNAETGQDWLGVLMPKRPVAERTLGGSDWRLGIHP